MNAICRLDLDFTSNLSYPSRRTILTQSSSAHVRQASFRSSPYAQNTRSNKSGNCPYLIRSMFYCENIDTEGPKISAAVQFCFCLFVFFP